MCLTWALLHVLAMAVHGDPCTAALQETQQLSKEKVCCSPGNVKSNIPAVRCPANPIANGSACCVLSNEWLCSYDEEKCAQQRKESEEAADVAQMSMIIVFSVVGSCCCLCVAVSVLQDRKGSQESGVEDEGDGANEENGHVVQVAAAQEST